MGRLRASKSTEAGSISATEQPLPHHRYDYSVHSTILGVAKDDFTILVRSLVRRCDTPAASTATQRAKHVSGFLRTGEPTQHNGVSHHKAINQPTLSRLSFVLCKPSAARAGARCLVWRILEANVAKSNPEASYQSAPGSNISQPTADNSMVPLGALLNATNGAQSSLMTFAAAPSAAPQASTTAHPPYYAYEHDKQIPMYLYDADPGSPVGSFWVDVNFTSFGGSVKVNSITIVNPNDFAITIGTFRWQASDGSPIYRGPGETIQPHSISPPWEPGVRPIPFSGKPFVDVEAHSGFQNGNVYWGEDRVYAAPPSYQYTPL